MKKFFEILKSNAFLEKLLLLLITAAITGILVPEIAGRLSEIRFRKQKLFEAELQRQHDIISSQSEFFEILSKLLWEFQLMNIDVSFYKINGIETGYRKSVERYQSNAAEILGQIRTQMSASKRLVSPNMQERLSQLYFNTLLQIDANLEMLIKKAEHAQATEWQEQYDASFGDAQKNVDNVLIELASELTLTAPLANAKGN